MTDELPQDKTTLGHLCPEHESCKVLLVCHNQDHQKEKEKDGLDPKEGFTDLRLQDIYTLDITGDKSPQHFKEDITSSDLLRHRRFPEEFTIVSFRYCPDWVLSAHRTAYNTFQLTAPGGFIEINNPGAVNEYEDLIKPFEKVGFLYIHPEDRIQVPGVKDVMIFWKPFADGAS